MKPLDLAREGSVGGEPLPLGQAVDGVDLGQAEVVEGQEVAVYTLAVNIVLLPKRIRS